MLRALADRASDKSITGNGCTTMNPCLIFVGFCICVNSQLVYTSVPGFLGFGTGHVCQCPVKIRDACLLNLYRGSAIRSTEESGTESYRQFRG